jgi:hypothetical protein
MAMKMVDVIGTTHVGQSEIIVGQILSAHEMRRAFKG